MNQRTKETIKARKRGRAMEDLGKVLQRLQFSCVPLDHNVYVIGKKEMCLYVRDLIIEVTKPEAAEIMQATSSELRASGEDDSHVPHVEAAGAEGTSATEESNVGAPVVPADSSSNESP